jgi:hypothetical protein
VESFFSQCSSFEACVRGPTNIAGMMVAGVVRMVIHLTANVTDFSEDVTEVMETAAVEEAMGEIDCQSWKCAG